MIGGAELADVLQPCPDIDGILVCPATIDLSGAEIELVDVPDREARLKTALRAYVSEHPEIDVILIRLPSVSRARDAQRDGCCRRGVDSHSG